MPSTSSWRHRRDLAEVYTHLDDHAREILYRVEKGFLARRVPHWPDAIDWGLTAPVRVYGKAGWGPSASTRAYSRRTSVPGLSPRWARIFPTSGTDRTTKGLARSPTSGKPSIRVGTVSVTVDLAIAAPCAGRWRGPPTSSNRLSSTARFTACSPQRRPW